MAKNKRVSMYLDGQWLQALAALAGTFSVSAEEVIRRSLPEEAVIRLFFQCRDFLPELRWDQVADVGRDAIRAHLRSRYRAGLEAHLARLGVSLESTAEEVEAARKRAFAELRSDAARPLDDQIAKAEEDSVYLGVLHDAWKRAKAGQEGYRIAQVESDGPPTTGGAVEPSAHRRWAVLKDGRIV
jgi:hypothetical protein